MPSMDDEDGTHPFPSTPPIFGEQVSVSKSQ